MAEANAVSEAPPRPRGNRMIIIIATISVVVIFSVVLIGLRSCSAPSTPKQTQAKTTSAQEPPKPTSGNVVIYSNLDLKDAAAVIAGLKELKISYQIKDEGRAIAVPRNKADEARLGLAEKNLPTGGSVGWEIFDQSKLGATDFDRRIQFIRAISGELSRTINRISSVQDSRVQIVIPETQLFQATVSPVTASVLLKLNPGMKLTQMQINAIVYLVSGSVENLRRENVTIIDTDGNILAGAGITPSVMKSFEEQTAVREEIPSGPVEQGEQQEQVIVEKSAEKEALEVQAKLDLEADLTGKVQSILNKLYPPNVTMTKVSIDSIRTRKMSIMILVDKKYPVDKALKQTTFDSVAAATGYERERGDKITMKSVTFRAVTSAAAPPRTETASVVRALARRSAFILFALAGLVMLTIVVMFMRRGKRKPAEIQQTEEAAQASEAAAEAPSEEVPVVEEMKTLATQNPAQVAELIKTWMAEEGA